MIAETYQSQPPATSRLVHRVAVGASFFLQGLCFSSWAARIPTVQQRLHLSDTELGGVLLAVPVGLLLSLPLSGWLVARYGSRRITVLGLSIYATVLTLLGLAETTTQLLGASCFLAWQLTCPTSALIPKLLASKPSIASLLWPLSMVSGVWQALLGPLLAPS
ncbi:hypothetical protein [Hymenobacter volaticus]|uniref:Major facilitator superfamily (MFS) profile domain-containing protein n=1 Tax=Hymenobacter volaticus TaxID=2932254 RepID=A0ABY4GB11_9BACT|nr:hypothetical protein [Hymenobacter volaticus]UOQ68078.1 hypothetical protein MUN86_09625 [Hymenobacter volaticus]